jgi:DNA-directed RNA polymerase subunit RPC12/RpoP
MSIVAQCECGKRMKVADGMSGRSVRCPGCGEAVLVPAGPPVMAAVAAQPAEDAEAEAAAAARRAAIAAAARGGSAPAAPAAKLPMRPGMKPRPATATAKAVSAKPAGKAAPAADRKSADATPAFAVSPTLLIWGGIGALVVGVILTIYFGPLRIGNEWEARSGQAGTEVTDVVMYALQAHQSQGMAAMGNDDASGGGPGAAMALGKAPAIESPAKFIPPMLAFSMPQHVIVTGRTSQGGYRGTYDTTNGEVVLDIDTGGYSVGGMADLKKATGSMHVTGREKDGKVTAECDGAPLTIFVPKWKGYHGELGS